MEPWQHKLLSNFRDIKRVTDTQEGKQLLALLEEQFASHNTVGKDALETYFNLGQQSVVSYIRMIADTAPAELDKLTKLKGAR